MFQTEQISLVARQLDALACDWSAFELYKKEIPKIHNHDTQPQGTPMYRAICLPAALLICALVAVSIGVSTFISPI